MPDSQDGWPSRFARVLRALGQPPVAQGGGGPSLRELIDRAGWGGRRPVLRGAGLAVAPPPAEVRGVARGISRAPTPASVARSLDRATDALTSLQHPDGYWVAELEANVSLDAETIFLMHYTGRVDATKERRLVNHLRETQGADGSWPLHAGGPGDLSVTIEAYFAAKLAGEPADAPWMARARAFALARGGVMKSRVMTRMYLAFFGEFDWQGVPAMPVSILFLPTFARFNIYNISYWARTCVVPLLVLCERRFEVRPLGGKGADELYVGGRAAADHSQRERADFFTWRNFFIQADRFLKWFGRVPIRFHREAGLRRAERWILEHQDDSGDWGGIFPAMAHSIMALHALGYPHDHPAMRRGFEALERLSLLDGETLRIQPCVSPVWDTAWAILALGEADRARYDAAIERGVEWLYSEQIRRPGDWSIRCPDLTPGGWAFQFWNDFYPDTDDSSVVLMALLHGDHERGTGRRAAYELGLNWLLGMQNPDGGFAAFEREVDDAVFDEILFNDAKNMLDPSTSDVTGRVLEVLGRLGYGPDHPAAARALRFLAKEQEPDGKWWGRWGVNYIYGTWSVLSGLRAIGLDDGSPMVQRAVAWLEGRQNRDGGWGETCESYADPKLAGVGPSTASQTAWALLGLFAAGQADGESARRGIQHLLHAQTAEGLWEEPEFTGTGFPRAFYLRYHYYRIYFPILALARYRDLTR